jgi:hypothetical protein
VSLTFVRRRSLSTLIVAATGRNVLRVVTAFERQRLTVARADDVRTACDQIARELPYVVLSLTPTKAETDGRLADVAAAVGAELVYLDPRADDAVFQETLDRAVRTALERCPPPESSGRPSGSPSTPAPETVDEDWDK